mmetsp:Transcript_28700/g.38119  ORF Transcript_28700/g.38119 Transcript_28700/m.38119 type:complete len:245 (+) Transcript_28700:183-917(+)
MHDAILTLVWMYIWTFLSRSTLTIYVFYPCLLHFQLKLLRVVVKNLADPVKAQDPKYRQLRLSNEKVQAKLLPCPSAVDYMKSIGFTEVTDADGSQYLRIDISKEVNVVHMAASLTELSNALEMVDPTAATAKKAPPSRASSFGEEKKTPEGIIIRNTLSSVSSSSSSSVTSSMSEKQKARILLDKKRQREAEEAKEARTKTSALIKQDKYVRENDDNWKSGQSAACVKSGDKISTFREKYGER